jgi:putative membrane protein
MLIKILLAAAIAAPAAVLAAGAAPTDPQIAAIAYTADSVDIAAGKQALNKSHNSAVRAFAQEMVRDHTAVNNQALALVKKLNVTPQPSATSRQIADGGTAERAKLAKLSGAAFDRAYADNEVAYHKTVNEALRDTLIPSASNAQLKAFLETGLKLFTSHEEHAEHLAAQLK